jgi:GNAT superfamily N-acetyltransferase
MVENEKMIPAGWKRAGTHHYFTLEAGKQLSISQADETIWNRLTLNRMPNAAAVAEQLFPVDDAGEQVAQERREGFYATLCTKRNRGAARVWTLEDKKSGEIVCTVGAYALYAGEAYLACGQTVEALRGRGIGGRLIAQMANELAAEGWRVSLLCTEERVHFYTRMGLTQTAQLVLCKAPNDSE